MAMTVLSSVCRLSSSLLNRRSKKYFVLSVLYSLHPASLSQNRLWLISPNYQHLLPLSLSAAISRPLPGLAAIIRTKKKLSACLISADCCSDLLITGPVSQSRRIILAMVPGGCSLPSPNKDLINNADPNVMII